MIKTRLSKSLGKLKQDLDVLSETMIGYPVNLKHDYSALSPFFKYSLNNVGDPFQDCTYKIHTREIERKVVAWFAKLYGFPKHEFWGYVTSGGTEGNLFGIYLGRERFPKTVLLASRDVHYSIGKIARLLNMKLILIPSDDHGELDYDKLESILKSLRATPVININLGTTVKGAVDSLKRVHQILRKLKIRKYHIHCDAALYGMILPFINTERSVNYKDGFDSIAISGHKFIGSPFPCGITITKKEYIGTLQNQIDYLDSIDDTILGSRSGHAPLFLWYAIKTMGRKGFGKMANDCMNNARYLQKRLKDLDYPVMRNRSSNTVVLKRPSDHLVDRWQLASSDGWSHVVVMPSVTRKKINQFVRELKKEMRI